MQRWGRLTWQLRRVTVSVPADIAEGFRKRDRADKSGFLNIAQGSLEEARYYLIVAGDPEYRNPTELMARATEVNKLLEPYSRSILSSDF